jgi:3-oxoacyl-[acyl-carrier-protein] synthase III
MNAKITAIGHYIPDTIIDNKFIQDKYNYDAQRIVERTGIKERRYVDKGVTTTDIACHAINDLLKNTYVSINDIDCIIVGTLTPDFYFPSDAVAVINRLKAKNAWGFDLSAACSGFCYGMSIASAMIKAGTIKNAIICGAERMSATLNNFDYKTGVLFGDGAGAVLIEATRDEDYKLVGSLCKVQADNLEDVYFKTPFNTENWNDEKFELDGGRVYDSGVHLMAETIKEYLSKNNLALSDFDYIVPHQSNLRMLKDVALKLNKTTDFFKINIEKVGNTGGASIPVCLSDFVKRGEVKKGDRILLCSFGAGYTISIIDLVWAI